MKTLFIISIQLSLVLLSYCTSPKEHKSNNNLRHPSIQCNDFIDDIAIEIETKSKEYYKAKQLKNVKITGFIDSLGQKQGYWIIENDTICMSGNFINNKKQAFWRQYNKVNNYSKTVHYKNDTLNGLAQKFINDTILLVQGNYYRGYKHGFWKTFSQNQVIVAQGKYNLGYKMDWWQFYDIEGKLMLEANYINNEINGLVRRYNKGYIAEEGIENQGAKKGVWKYYNETGTLKSIQEYE